MTNYPQAVTVTPTINAVANPQQLLLGPVSESVTVQDAALSWLGLIINDTATVSLSTTLLMKWGRTITDAVKVKQTDAEQTYYGVTLAQLMKVRDAITVALPAGVAEHMTVTQTQNAALGLFILDRMNILPHLGPQTTFNVALSDDFTIHSAVGRFLGETITDGMTVGSTLTKQYRALTTLIQDMTLLDALAGTLSLSVVDDLTLTDTQLVQALFNASIQDNMQIKLLYVSPSGFATTWAMNTRSSAVTEYKNFNFTGFAQMGLKYIALSPQGVFELDGPTDNNAAIIAEIETGMMQLNASKLGGLKGLYLGMDGQGTFYCKIKDGVGHEYVYKLQAQPGLETTKVNIGKGLRARYMSFKLISTGPDFRLDTIEFIPMRSDRRV